MHCLSNSFDKHAVLFSANQVLVTIEVVPDTVANLLETGLGDQTTGVARRLGDTSTVFHMRLLLHLADRGGSGILLTVVERVVLLGDLQTEDGVANKSTYGNKSAKEGGNLGTLKLEMHSRTGVWQLEV